MTLVEVLLLLAIIGILVAITVPGFIEARRELKKLREQQEVEQQFFRGDRDKDPLPAQPE